MWPACSLQAQPVGRWPPPALQPAAQKQPSMVPHCPAGFSGLQRPGRVVICRFRGRSPPDTNNEETQQGRTRGRRQPKPKNQKSANQGQEPEDTSGDKKEADPKQLQTISDAATAAAEAHAAKVESAVEAGSVHVTPIDTADLDTPLPSLETTPSAGHIAALDVEAFAGNATSDDPTDATPNVTPPTTTTREKKQGKGGGEGDVEVKVDVEHGLVDFTTEEMRESAGLEGQQDTDREGSPKSAPAPERQDAAAALQLGQGSGKQPQGPDSLQEDKLKQTGRDKGSGVKDQSAEARAQAVMREMEKDMSEGGDVKPQDFMAMRQEDLSTSRSGSSTPERETSSTAADAEHGSSSRQASPGSQVVNDRPADSSADKKEEQLASPLPGSDLANDAPHDAGADVNADIPADVLRERATDPGLEPLLSPLGHPIRSAESGPVQDEVREKHRQHQLQIALKEQKDAAKRHAAEEEVQELVDHPDQVIAEMQHQPWGAGVFPEYVHALADVAAELEESAKDQSPQPADHSEQDENVTRARKEALSKFTATTGQDSSSFLTSLNSPRVRSPTPAEEEGDVKAKEDVSESARKLEKDTTANQVDNATARTGGSSADASTKPSAASTSTSADPAVEAQRQGVAKAANVDADEMPAEQASQTRSGEGAEKQSLQAAMAAAAEALEESQLEQAQARGQPTQKVMPAESTSTLAQSAPRVTPEELAGEAKVMLLEAMCEEVRAVRIDMQHAVRLLKDMRKALAFTQQTISKLPPEAADNLQQTILQEMARLEVQVNSAEAGMSSLALAMTHLQRGGPVPALETVEQYMQYIEGMAETLAEGAPGMSHTSTSESSTESAGEEGHDSGKKPLTGLLVKSAEVLRDELSATLQEGTHGGATHTPGKRSRLSRRLMAMAHSKFGHLAAAQGDTDLAMQLGFVPEGDTPGMHAQQDGKQPAGASPTAGKSSSEASSPATADAVPAKASSSAAGASDVGLSGSSSSTSGSSSGPMDESRTPTGGTMKREPPIGGGGGGGGARPPRPTAEGSGSGDGGRSPLGSWLLVCSVAVGLSAAAWQAARHYSDWSPFVKRPAAGSVVATSGTDGTSTTATTTHPHPHPHLPTTHTPHPLPAEQQGLHHVWHQHQETEHADARKAVEEHHRTVLEKASDAAGHVGELLVAVPHLKVPHQHEHTGEEGSVGEHRISKPAPGTHNTDKPQHMHGTDASHHAASHHGLVHNPTAKHEVVGGSKVEPQGTGHAVEGGSLPEALQECGQELKEVMVAAAEEVKEFQDAAAVVSFKGIDKARVGLRKLGKAVQDPEGMLITLSVAGAIVGLGKPPLLNKVFGRSRFMDEGGTAAAAAAAFDCSDAAAMPLNPGSKRG